MSLKLFNCSFFIFALFMFPRPEWNLRWNGRVCCNLSYFHPSRSCSPRFSLSFWWHDLITRPSLCGLGHFYCRRILFFFLQFIQFQSKWRFSIWMWTQSHSHILSSSTIWVFDDDEQTSNLVEKMMDAFYLTFSSTTTKQKIKKTKSFLCSC